MSDLSGLPAYAIARAASNAAIQNVAVRLLTLPDDLQNNPQPLNLKGTVQGQNADGSVKVETDRGVINILLKDRGNLPPGQKIEIDIPAGRPPQQAAIRPQPLSPVLQNPRLEIPIDNNAPPTGGSIKFDRPTTSPIPGETILQPDPGIENPPSAPLQAGQILRLLPIPLPISLTPDASLGVSNATILKPEALFNSLLHTIEQSIELPQEIKRNLVQILARIDPSSLFPPSLEETASTPQQAITTAFQKIVQQLELPETLKLQNASLQNIPLASFNPTKSLDVKILAFQNGSFEAVLTNTQNPSQNPAIDLKNFTVLPQAVLPNAPSAPVQPQQVNLLPSQIPASPILAQASEPPALLGQVVSFTSSGQAVVSITLPGSAQPQTYAVQFIANNLTEGAPIIVSPLPLQESSTPRAGFVPFAIDNIPLGEWIKADSWGSLQSLITTIAHLNPGMAQSLIQMLPNAHQPQNLGILGMIFVSMIRNGKLGDWVGEDILDTLKQNGKIDILRALAGESSLAGKLDTAPLPNDWKAAIFPFWHDNQINKLPLYFKKWNDEGEDAEKSEREKKMRFMFELKLSRMGPVQVDGFMQTKKLDMILRTKSIISTPMQEALRKTYHTSMERSNLSGEITFQFKPEQWVNVEMDKTHA